MRRLGGPADYWSGATTIVDNARCQVQHVSMIAFCAVCHQRPRIAGYVRCGDCNAAAGVVIDRKAKRPSVRANQGQMLKTSFQQSDPDELDADEWWT
jgi:hypothetical protein